MSFFQLISAWGHVQFEQLKDGVNRKNFDKSDSEQARIAEEIRKNGIYVLTDYYSQEECDKIIGEIDRLVQGSEAHIWQDEAQSDTRIYGSHLYSEAIFKFHSDPFLKEIGERYLKSELINSHTLGAKLIPKADNLGSGGGWHRDSVYKKQYKSIVYLTDVGDENGPFQYVTGSHDKSTIYSSIKKSGFKAHQNRITNDQVEEFIAKCPDLESRIYTATRGTVILVDTSGIHRGMPIQSGERYALTNYFYPKHHYTQKQREKFEGLF